MGGIDWGYVHAFAAEVLGESGAGRRAVIAEVYERGELLGGKDEKGTLIPRLLRLQDELKVDLWYDDPSEPAYIAQCKAAGLRVVEATNDVIPGITAVERSIQAGMTVDPGCAGLLAEIPDYTWKRERSTGAEKEEPVDVGDDACDALRYGVMGLDRGTPGLLAHYRAQAAARAAAAAAAKGASA